MNQNLTIDNQLHENDCEWWHKRVVDPTPLTEYENKIIHGCGGLTYLYTYAKHKGFEAAQMRSVSEKHYYDCVRNCVCGRNYRTQEDDEDDDE